jgi:hypothetical protein
MAFAATHTLRSTRAADAGLRAYVGMAAAAETLIADQPRGR